MGLWSFLFGPSRPSEEGAEIPEEERPHYGRLAEREKLAERLRQRVEKRGQRAAAGAHLWGLGRPARMLSGRVREEQLAGWPRVTRKVKKLERKLGEAESAEGIRKVSRRALGRTGIFRKIERGMERRLQGASTSERRPYERDLRMLRRRLENPSRYLRR